MKDVERVPSFEFECAVFESGASFVVGLDEVGRGALAGPVMVGATLFDARDSRHLHGPLEGLCDSKLMRVPMRTRLAPQIQQWATDSAVGSASAAEIDEFGIVFALRMAGWRALLALHTLPEVVLLDGNHNWLSVEPPAALKIDRSAPVLLNVQTIVKGDMRCASIAAASVIAKVTRDEHMVALARSFPQYGWDQNKGYGTAVHKAAIAAHGACVEHRKTWKL